MKKLIFTFLQLFMFVAIYGQQRAQYDYHIERILRSSQTKNEWMHVFLQGDVSKISHALQSLGGKIKYVAGDIISAEVKSQSIGTLLTTAGVARMESRPTRWVALNDTMRVNNNINEIHQGLAPLPQAYTGKNVVMGFIDTGIDFLHPDFRDSANNTRIAYLWDHTLPAGSNTPAPYSYGQEFNAAEINSGTCTQLAADGHGTYVAGVGAGNGMATGGNEGVGKDADIIAVKYDFASSAPGRVADAVEYIFTKAAAMGKPCVINASLGDYYGSHDGRDLEAQAIKNLLLAQPGRLMVGAIGNFGTRPFHMGYTANIDTQFTWFKHDNALGSFMPGLGVYIQVWGDSADMKNIKFSIGADVSIANYSYVGHTPFYNIPPMLNTSYYDTLKNNAGQRVARIERYLTKQADTYSLEFYIFPDSANYFWRLNTTGNGRFDVWNLLFSNYQSGMVDANLPSPAVNPEIIYYQLPNTDMTMVSSFACLDEVITVGDYLNRSAHKNCQDSLVSLVGFAPKGSIIANSSHGPTRDNRVKPDICASGSYNMAAFPLAYFAANATSNKNLKGCFHYGSGGSSFAAPVVAGIGALMLEKDPQLTATDFVQHIICSAKTDTNTGTQLPNAIWGYGKVDGFKAITTCATAINEYSLTHIVVNIFPNPMLQQSTIYIAGIMPQQNINISCVDITGKAIWQNNFVATSKYSRFVIDKSQLAPGIYFVNIMVNYERPATRKLIVQ